LALATLAAMLVLGGTRVIAQEFGQERTLRSFNATGPGGNSPYASLILDNAGNLYGTTDSGGNRGAGNVFELTHGTGGGWSERVLHNLNSNGADGRNPGASLIFDGAGNLYGTATSGGVYHSGVVFELTPSTTGQWSETILHAFNSNGVDGYAPIGSLIMDHLGNLYGTTSAGGALEGGTVFRLAQKNGRWVEKILHNFDDAGTDGYMPDSGLTLDAAGNLYGTTYYGGTYAHGTVFELTPGAGGVWTENLLHSFNNDGVDGYYPYAGLVIDSAGNLCGTTVFGGIYESPYGYGTVFELSPVSGGAWTETVLHSFSGDAGDGRNPAGGLIFDSAGNLYGTTYFGGISGGGIAYELISADGWAETVLHPFGGGSDGYSPQASLVFDSAGNLYGTTYEGGAYNYGAVFEIAAQAR
jgi:uncharacterized repeat protein (TIGR03803 family)